MRRTELSFSQKTAVLIAAGTVLALAVLWAGLPPGFAAAPYLTGGETALSALPAGALAALFLGCGLGIAGLIFPLAAFLSADGPRKTWAAAGLFSLCAGLWQGTAGLAGIIPAPPAVLEVASLTALYLLPVTILEFAAASSSVFGSGKGFSNLKRPYYLVALAAAVVAGGGLLPSATLSRIFPYAAAPALILLVFRAAARMRHFEAGPFLMICALAAFGAGIGALLAGAEVTGHAVWPHRLPAFGVLALLAGMLATARAEFAAAIDACRRRAEAEAALGRQYAKILQATKNSQELLAGRYRRLEDAIQSRTAEIEAARAEAAAAREELVRLRERLAIAERQGGAAEMAAGLAHDINTPLGVCVTAVSNLGRQVEELAEAYQTGTVKKSDMERHLSLCAETVDTVLANLRRAIDLARRLKVLAADRAKGERRKFALTDYIRQVAATLRPQVERAGHRVVVLGDDELEVVSYPDALAQALTNLIVNAVRHAFAESESGTITVTVGQSGRLATVTVADNGRGIAPELLPRIFEPFVSTRPGADGAGGLGLSIVHGIVTRELGGHITCDSAPGRGTAFIIRFPIGELEKE